MKIIPSEKRNASVKFSFQPPTYKKLKRNTYVECFDVGDELQHLLLRREMLAQRRKVLSDRIKVRKKERNKLTKYPKLKPKCKGGYYSKPLSEDEIPF